MKKTIVVTGANSGIGKSLVEELASKGHNVILVSRDSEKTTTVYENIKQKYGKNCVSLITADLSNPKDVGILIEELSNLKDQIDVLINNAGLLRLKKSISVEDIEMTMSVNYLSVYRLVMGLINNDKMPKRMINITSELFKKGDLNFDDMFNPKKYNGSKAYSDSKMANLAFSGTLYKNHKEMLEVIGMHPGVVATDASRDYPKWVIKLMNKLLEKPESAASKIIEVALSDDIKNGYYYNQSMPKEKISTYINDEISEKLFEISKQYLIGAGGEK